MRWSSEPFTWLMVLVTSVCAETFASTKVAPEHLEGQQIFKAVCSACHGLDGRGGERAPNISTASKVQLASDNELLNIIQRGIPSQGMPGFDRTLSKAQLREVVMYLRKLQGKTESISNHGNVSAGKDLFFGRAKCADCHSVHGQGGFIASDLSSFGSTHSIQEIRSAIINPTENAEHPSETVTVTTVQGQTYTGVARNEDNFTLQLQTFDGNFHFFDKSDLVLVKRDRRSSMPDNYRSILTSSEVEDLVAYLHL